MPKALDTARKVILLDIPSDQLARVLVANVFDLIEALQEKRP
jgi:ABC-type branched-subunit amino acid transport system ATPase component